MRLLRPLSLRSPTGSRLHGLVARPHTPGPHPVVIRLPGAVGSGLAMAADAGAARLVACGVAVVGFNAAGRGGGRPWNPRSSGEPDLNGPRDQDDLAAIIRHIASRRWAGRLGLASVSYGLVAAVGCLHRHPDLPVRFLIDEEGPADRHDALLRAWTLADVPGPDWPGRAAALFGVGTADDAFWEHREPVRMIGTFRGAYLRLQAELDHVQPPARYGHRPLFHQPPRWWAGKHAVRMANAAVEGGVPWVRVGLAADGNTASRLWSQQDPPILAPGRMTEHPDAWVEGALELATH